MDISGSVEGYEEKIHEEFVEMFEEERTPHQEAASFSIGMFITMLPTFGSGFLVLFGTMRFWGNASKVALLAPVVVLNPFFRSFLYVGSVGLGSFILTGQWAAAKVGAATLSYFLVGAFVSGLLIAGVSYILVFESVKRHRRSDIDLVSEFTQFFGGLERSFFLRI